MNINANIDAVRRHLLKPMAQSPNTDTILGAIFDEVTHLENELGNAGTGLNLRTVRISLGGRTDYTIGEDVGKVLFVTSDDDNAYNLGYGLEFTDLRDASENWWCYQPVTAERPADYGFWQGFGNKIAFYREDGKVKVKVPQVFSGSNRLIIKTAQTGSRELDLTSSASLPSYHPLINVRAAQNVLAGAQWSDDAARDENTRRNLMQSLPRQEQRYYDQFIIAKRSPTASDAVYIETEEW